MYEATASVLGLEGEEVQGAVETEEGWQVDVVPPLPRACPRCSGRVHRHGRVPQRCVSHAWLAAKPVRLSWTPVRGRCAGCGRTLTTRPAGLERWQRMTPQAKETALVALRQQSFRSIATLLGVGSRSLCRLVDRNVPLEIDAWQQLAGELVISIDEHSFRGKDLMITVALLSPERRLLAVLDDDRIDTLKAWFKGLPERVRGRIGVVTTDLKASYRKAVGEVCPQAMVAPDPFHMVRHMTASVDEVRRLEQAETGEGILRWPLLKGAERLTPKQIDQLGRICRDFPALGALYALKEEFRGVLQATDLQGAKEKLSRWLINAEACEHAEGRVLAGLIRRWRKNLLFHWQTAERWTNGFIEGLHTKMKLLKRISYGFRNRDRYRKKMLLGFLPPSAIPQFLT